MLITPLLRYRVVAYIVSTFFAILCFVGLPLKYVGGHAGFVDMAWTIHGFIYLVYVIFSFELAIRYRFSLARTVLTMLAGTLPLMGYVAERKTTHLVRAREAARVVVPADVPTSAA